MGLLNKPIFGKWYSSKKPPTLQIKILKLITLQGELSKTKASKDLDSNYSDVSDAMDALAANERQFIKLSRETGRGRPEKFYKITESGLRALLAINKASNEDIDTFMVFSRVMILLSICSKRPISKEELDDYYRQFEKNFLRHSTIYPYFFQSNFFNTMLDNWIGNLSKGFASQMVVECLAINRSMTLDDLIKKTGLKKDEVIAILHNHSLQTDLHVLNATSKVYSDIDVQKNNYVNFMSHAIIGKTGNTYELSLFGVMLVICLIRYHFAGLDSDRFDNLDSNPAKIDLFYNDMGPNDYCDLIAKNYKEKLDLIFGKWNLLQSQLGRFLYGSFDFLIYKKDNNTSDSVWRGGNKEFYDDIQTLASNARDFSKILYVYGKYTMNKFGRYADIMHPRMIPLRQKLYEMGVIFDANIPLTESSGMDHLSSSIESESQTLQRVKIIEDIFAKELTFLFYLNLNTFRLSNRVVHPNEFSPLGLTPSELTQWAFEKRKEMIPLKERLMAILTKDNDIKGWFTERIDDIMHYREQTSNKMSEFYNEILDPTKYMFTEQNEQMNEEINVKGKITLEEFDVNKICSY
jgi:hypothetical protein